MSGIPADLHRVFVLLHIIGAIFFMGNIIVTAMWMNAAKRTRDVAVLHFASRAVQRADMMFTLPGIVLLLGTGLLTMGAWGGFGKAHWAEMGLALFILSWLIAGFVLVPAQHRMVRLTGEAVDLGIGLSDEFYATHKRWMVWGGIATLLPFITLYLMVFKPAMFS